MRRVAHISVLMVLVLLAGCGDSGPSGVEVPDFIGAYGGDAQEELERLGLVDELVQIHGRPFGQVLHQSPPAGDELDPGSTVILTIADPEIPSGAQLATGVKAELDALGGTDRWAVKRVVPNGPGAVTVITSLYPDSEADPAVTGICVTILEPVTQSYELESASVDGLGRTPLGQC